MKLAMFLLENSEDAELVVHCDNKQTNQSFTVSLTCCDLNNANIQVLPPTFITAVTNSFSYKGKHAKDYNVFVFYKVNDKTSGLEYKEDNISLLAELCDFNGFEFDVHLYDDKHHRLCPTKQKLQEYFCIDSETFEIRDIVYPEREDNKFGGKKFNASVEVQVYPGFAANSESNARMRLICLDKKSDQYGAYIQDLKLARNNTVFLKYDMELINNRRGCTTKDIARMHEDAFYTANNAASILAGIGLQCTTKRNNFVDKLGDYDFVEPYGDIVGKIGMWNPTVKVFVTIKDSNDLKKETINSILSLFSKVNEYFYCSDNSLARVIIEAIFGKLVNDNPQNLIDFRARMKKHFPFDSSQLLPIPNNESIILRKDRIYVYDDKGNKIDSVKPGQVKCGVTLRFKDDTPVTDISANGVSRGFKLDKQGMAFDLTIRGLAYLDDDGTPHSISAAEYGTDHTKTYIPTKHCTVDIGETKYLLDLTCDVPKRKTTAGKPIGRSNKKSITDSGITNYYRGPIDEIGKYNHGVLQLNQDSPLLRDIIYRDHNAHPWLLKSFEKIYNDMSLRAQKLTAEFDDYLSKDLELKGAKKGDYTNDRTYMLNIGLKAWWDGSELVNSVKARLKKEEPTIIDKNDVSLVIPHPSQEIMANDMFAVA
jgi:hypothetical protein